MPRWLFCRLPCFVIFFISIGVIGVLALPFVIEFFLLPPLLEKLPFSTSRASIFRVSPGTASGSLELRHGGVPVLSLPQFRLHYSPTSLIGGKIDSLHIEQAVLHLYREGRGWAVPGIKSRAADAAAPDSEYSVLAPPLQLEALFLERCLIVLHDPDTEDIRIGVSGQFTPTYDNKATDRLLESISGSFSVYDDISAAVTLFVSQRSDQIDVRIGVKDAHWEIPENLVPDPLKQLEFGSFSADLDMILESRSFSLVRYGLSGGLQGVRLTEPEVQISGVGPDQRLIFSASGEGSEHRYAIHSMELSRPFRAGLDISGHASLTGQRLQTTGTVEAKLPAGNQPDSVQMTVLLDYTGSWSGNEGTILNAEGTLQPLQPLVLTEAGISSPATLQADRLNMALHLQSQDDHIQAELDLLSSSPRLTANDFEVNAADLQLRTILERRAGRSNVRVEGSLQNLAMAKEQISAHGVEFSLPLPSPYSDRAKTEIGSMLIDSVKLEGEHLFSLSTDIKLQGADYHVQGLIATPITPADTVVFTATASPLAGNADLSWKMAPARFSSGSLSVLDSMLPDLDFEALLEADGTISAAASRLSAMMRLRVTDGVAVDVDRNIRIEDIDCFIHLPELPRLVSSPSQRCSTGSIDISSLHFSSGDFTFRLEDSPALFIEKSMLQWCGGTLDSGSLRLSKGMSEIETTFYGSRIDLGQLLEQFGFMGTEGEGSLNGRLPITISNKRMKFDDGFLFSTPGTGGIVRFTNTDLLRQGIGGVSQAGTLSYALKALEDFSYNWTKLSFNTIDDELLLALELDGKPRTALPFQFDKNGMIIKSDKGAGLQYPMRLDVNFRLPLTELFQVGQSINSIMGNDQ